MIFTPHLGAATETAQLNVAIAVAEQVRDYLQRGVVRNAVNLPSVSAEDLEVLRPFIVLGEKLGLFQGQVATGGIAEIEVEYAGEIAGLNVQPISIAVLRGVLAPWFGDEVNYVNAPVIAQKQGIRVIETKSTEPEDFVSLVTVRVRERAGVEHLIAGTIFGRHPAAHRARRRLPLRSHSRGTDVPDPQPGPPGRGRSRGDAARRRRDQHQAHAARPAPRRPRQALQLLSIEPMPSGKVVEDVRALPGIETALLLDLGARVV